MDYSSENISKIFDTQRKNLKEDILFFKEDILKEFHQIETKLNTKYDKVNTNSSSKLEIFENNIKTMNDKISELSSLISIDKNTQEKISQLHAFKEKVGEDLMHTDLLIKSVAKDLKDAINNYDKILRNSVIYPSLIGFEGQFSSFHDLIDYVLLNINQFNSYKDNTVMEFKNYKTTIESLIKSFKLQADFIRSNTIEFTNSKIANFEEKYKNKINELETKLIDLKLDINKRDNKIDNEFKILNQKFDVLNEFNKSKKYDNEIKKIKERLYSLNELMKKMIKNSQKREKSEKNSFIANSVIKKYIEGGINANDIKNHLRRKQSECDLENNNRKNVLGYNKATNLTNSIKKRMTLGPEHFKALNNLGNNFINKYNDNSLDFENIKKFDNYINEEKDEDFSYMKNYRYNSDKIKKEMNNRNDGLKLYEDLCIYKGNKSLDKKKENDKRGIIYLKINNNTPKNSTKKEIININEKDRNIFLFK